MKKSTETGESYYRSVAETGNPAYRSAGSPPLIHEESGTIPYLKPIRMMPSSADGWAPMPANESLTLSAEPN